MKSFKIIDSHCHLHDERFAPDLKEVLDRARLADITHLINIGCDLPTIKRAMRIAHQFDHVFFAAGFHPHESKHLDDGALSELKSLAQDKKCVAIGECGLDYYYLHSSVEEQKHAFKKQLELACELGLPVVIHLRDAFVDCVSLLKLYIKNLKGVVLHCFSGTLEEAKIFEALGCFLSLSGIITFKKPGELLEVAREISLQRLLIETDCPYLAPHPFRGQRNEPAFIVQTLKAVADARNQDIELVANQIHKNTMQFFGLAE